MQNNQELLQPLARCTGGAGSSLRRRFEHLGARSGGGERKGGLGDLMGGLTDDFDKEGGRNSKRGGTGVSPWWPAQ
jgi:hypothetical protein